MTYHADVKTARIAAEKAVNSAPTAANLKQHALLNQFEVKLAELKVIAAQINAAGGILDSNSAAALSSLTGSV